jgi:hypothetical protein
VNPAAKKTTFYLAPAARLAPIACISFIMPRNDDAEDSSSGYLSSDDGGVRSDSSNEKDEGETEDKIEDNVSQGTVETFDSIDFLTPGGLFVQVGKGIVAVVAVEGAREGEV